MKIICKDEISIRSGYEASLALIFFYWKLTPIADLTDILSGGEYIDTDTPADSAFWRYWLDEIEHTKDGWITAKTLSTELGLDDVLANDDTDLFNVSRQISKKVAYEAMISMYYDYWKDTSNDDLSALLKQYLLKGPRFFLWDEWLKAVAFVQENGPKYKKK